MDEIKLVSRIMERSNVIFPNTEWIVTEPVMDGVQKIPIAFRVVMKRGKKQDDGLILGCCWYVYTGWSYNKDDGLVKETKPKLMEIPEEGHMDLLMFPEKPGILTVFCWLPTPKGHTKKMEHTEIEYKVVRV